jgi:hypothetical protein
MVELIPTKILESSFVLRCLVERGMILMSTPTIIPPAHHLVLPFRMT